MMPTNTQAHIITRNSPLSAFPCAVKLMKGGVVPDHWHNFPQIWYIAKGETLFTVSEKTFQVKRGSFVFVPAYAHHSIGEEKTDYEATSISFTDAMFGGFDDKFFFAGKFAHLNRHLINTATQFLGEEEKEAGILVGGIRTELLKGRNRNPAKISLSLLSLLRMMSCEKIDKREHVVVHNRIREISKIIRYITENISKKLTIEGLCTEFNMSQSTFVREFKKVTGMSFVQMMLSVRIRYACQQLRYTNKKIILIADEMGFYDESHLTHAFSSIVGISPAQYREEGRSPFEDVGFIL